MIILEYTEEQWSAIVAPINAAQGPGAYTYKLAVELEYFPEVTFTSLKTFDVFLADPCLSMILTIDPATLDPLPYEYILE